MNENLDCILAEINSLCNDNGITFSYYTFPEDMFVSLKFNKCGKAIRFKLGYQDIIYNDISIIMKEINKAIFELFDSIAAK